MKDFLREDENKVSNVVKVISIGDMNISSRLQNEVVRKEELVGVKARIIATPKDAVDESFQLGELLILKVPKRISPWRS
jgi:hypothetical protein